MPSLMVSLLKNNIWSHKQNIFSTLGLPDVHIKESKSLNGIPAIGVTFSDGFQDQFVLERHYMTEMDRTLQKVHCNFIGHLAKDTEACVAVTGCPGEKMEFSINSKNALRSNRFIIHENGEMENIESAFKDIDAFASPLRIPQHLRDDEEWELVDDDEVVNPDQIAEEMQFEASCAAGQCTALPATNLLTVKVGYDDTFNADLGSAAAAATYLDSVFTHVQTFYCHASLGSKIQIQRDGDYTHHSGQTWTAEGSTLDGPIMSITSASSSNANLFVYLCKDPQSWGVIGIAWVGTLCGPNSWKGYKASVNEKRSSAVKTAEVVAHEMGHNLGMLHDFDDQHGGQNGACNGQGIMSYGTFPQQWSSCSKADYLARYNQVGGNNWCMAGKQSRPEWPRELNTLFFLSNCSCSNCLWWICSFPTNNCRPNNYPHTNWCPKYPSPNNCCPIKFCCYDCQPRMVPR